MTSSGFLLSSFIVRTLQFQKDLVQFFDDDDGDDDDDDDGGGDDDPR